MSKCHTDKRRQAFIKIITSIHLYNKTALSSVTTFGHKIFRPKAASQKSRTKLFVLQICWVNGQVWRYATFCIQLSQVHGQCWYVAFYYHAHRLLYLIESTRASQHPAERTGPLDRVHDIPISRPGTRCGLAKSSYAEWNNRSKWKI